MIPPFIRLLFQWALCYSCIVFPPLTELDLHRIASPVISTNQPISNQETSVALACSAPSRNYSATKISNKQKLASESLSYQNHSEYPNETEICWYLYYRDVFKEFRNRKKSQLIIQWHPKCSLIILQSPRFHLIDLLKANIWSAYMYRL